MSHRHGCFMERRLAGLVTAGLVLAVSASVYAQTPVTPPGTGTESDPYLISELGHLVWMGDNARSSFGKYYTLTADIDASATAGWNDAGTDTAFLEGFKPIGTYSSPDTTRFRGTFDGNGHTVSGLVVNRPTTDNAGLFGCVASGGQVRNLGLIGGTVTGQNCVGGLAGYNDCGTVSNCFATGAVTGSFYVGGLLGRGNYGTISNCYATGAVTGTGDYRYSGGLVGYRDYGAVSNSYWDTQASGRSTSVAGTGKTTAEMKQQATFAGWDFTGVWGIVEGSSYPYLRVSPPPFKLTVSIAGPGNVTVDPPSADGTYAPGTVVTLMAVPDGSTTRLVRWAGAAPSGSPTVTVVMDIHRAVTAVFAPGIEINSLADLAKIGNDPAYPLVGALYVLTADIDASATGSWNDAGTGTDVLEGFKPIGTYSYPDTTSFRSVFDGDGHTISGLIVNRPATDYVGLIGCLGLGGQVRNLGLVGGAVTSRSYVGGLVGDNYCGTVANCYTASTVTGIGSNTYVGGVVGYNYYGTVSRCYAAGAVTGTGRYSYVGGVIGANYYGTILNCYAAGAVTGAGGYVGGLVGRNCQGTASNCHASSAVTGTGNDSYIGGLVGNNDAGRVSDCHASGPVTSTGNGSSVGGLVGDNCNSYSTVSNCYATGAVTGAESNVSGLVGRNASGTVSGTVSNSYWDMQTSGRTNSQQGGTGKTTAEMKQQATFAGWDFTGLWGIVEGTSYPYLRFSPPPFKLTVNVSGPGSVTVDPPSADGTYAPGTLVTLTPVPTGPTDAFIRWAGAVPSESATVTVVMDIHRSVAAVFGPRIEINALADLAKIGNDPGFPLADALYVLTADTDASATAAWNDAGTSTDVLEGFKPIGTYSSPDTTSFRGVFDGNGHTISGLVINRPATSYVGLFGCVGLGGQVRNLGLVGGVVTGKDYVGGLVGYNSYASVRDSYATGAATALGINSFVGGLVGYNCHYSTVSNCRAAGAVTGSNYVGGLLGYNCYYSTVSNSSATGVTTVAGSYVGGLIGCNYSTVSNGYATGAVTGSYSVGGLVGCNYSGTVSNCCATGAVTCRGNYVGGLIGDSLSGTVSNCYATGAVTGAGDYVGGLVGHTSGTISNGYATGAVTGMLTSRCIGGLVGYNDTSYSTVSNCYATGAVTGPYPVGGLIGYNANGTVSVSYWDMETSGQSTSDGGTGKATAEMRQQATFAGWDFTNLWGIIEGTSYPYLQFAAPPFRLTVNISGPGSVTVDPPSTDGTYAPGTLVTLTPVPNGSNAAFIRWTGATPSDSSTITVAMDIHRSVSAVFWPKIEINSLADLAKIGNEPAYPLTDVLYVMTADIDASATAGWNDAGTSTDVLEGFKPIGPHSSPDTTSFRGIFDGNGHTVIGLVVNRAATNYAGLFGTVGENGKVQNLGVVGGAVTGHSYVGGLTGYNYAGTVSNCYATGVVTGSYYSTGGLVGCNYYGTVSNSYATGATTGTDNAVGGLLGSNSYGTVSNCYATGSATGTGNDVGGLVGHSHYGAVSNCCATGAATGASSVGGLVGYKEYSAVSNCCAAGPATGTGDAVGGLIGSNYFNTVSSCYATGAVTGGRGVGGLAGYSYSGTISDCCATGSVTAYYLGGGLVASCDSVTVSNCYATGAVTGTSYVGGLLGKRNYGTVLNSYWDMQTSGRSTSAGGTGKTTAEMKQQVTFAGWDYANVWGIVETASYPHLQVSPPPFKLMVNISGPGSVTVDPPSADGRYAPGTLVTLTAVPSGPTDVFIQWAGAAPSASPTVTAVMDIHRSVTAVFWPRIEINSLADLAKIGNEPGYPLADALYVLTADIDASATAGWNDAGTGTDVLEGFKPIGTYSSPDTTSFRGIFDGNGHTIRGLVINRPATNYVGLFGYVGSTGQVRNLGLLDGAVTGKDYVSGLAGYIYYYATVSNCYTTGTVTGLTVNGCVGGLLGYNYYGTASNCYAASTVTGAGDYVGGLLGYSYYGAVSNCHATGAPTGASYVGGLLGYNRYGTVSNCYATGAAAGTRGYVGGLLGYNSYGTISNCYATGAAAGPYAAGGVLGYNENGIVSKCYATGGVTGSSYAGGLVGYNAYGTVSNSYWDTQTSGRSTSAGGTGKTTAQMKQQATFVGWDFNILWGITENVTYPFLRSPVSADFDGDHDVDMGDFGHFRSCFNGPNRPPAQPDCGDADLDGDADVDLADFGAFRSCFNGPNRPPQCS